MNEDILIIGGTGTLGRELTRQLLTEAGTRITILSRDELKQKQMQEEFNSDRLRFALGDIRDKATIAPYCRMKDAIFHVAALKHIDVLEDNPEESVRTNILGTINVADAATDGRSSYVVFSSTDKAVYPINTYGMCKGISERILLERHKRRPGPWFKVYRWGNVVGSRGAAIHAFARTLKAEKTAFVTHKDMTRYWIRIEDAVRFMLTTYKEEAEQVLVPRMKAAPVVEVIDAIARHLDISGYQLSYTGIRRGEKLHEAIHAAPEGSLPETSETAERLSADELARMVAGVLG